MVATTLVDLLFIELMSSKCTINQYISHMNWYHKRKGTFQQRFHSKEFLLGARFKPVTFQPRSSLICTKFVHSVIFKNSKVLLKLNFETTIEHQDWRSTAWLAQRLYFCFSPSHPGLNLGTPECFPNDFSSTIPRGTCCKEMWTTRIPKTKKPITNETKPDLINIEISYWLKMVAWLVRADQNELNIFLWTGLVLTAGLFSILVLSKSFFSFSCFPTMLTNCFLFESAEWSLHYNFLLGERMVMNVNESQANNESGGRRNICSDRLFLQQQLFRHI